MFVVNSYSLAVIFCFITMLCWGSWGNTQKLAGKTWRYELFYWDYVIGMVLFAILLGFTMGSIGTEGRPFLEDLAQAEWGGIGSVVLGGVIFNASNILLSASVSLAGLSVAFPLGVGLGWCWASSSTTSERRKAIPSCFSWALRSSLSQSSATASPRGACARAATRRPRTAKASYWPS